MKVRDIMTEQVIKIGAEEPVSVAARALERYNIGALPVCDQRGNLCGMVTDRDLVTRCLAAERAAEQTRVRDVMTSSVLTVKPDMEVSVAAHMMGRQQVRRLPVVENGMLCGMVSLGDVANCDDSGYDAAEALTRITGNLSSRD